MTPLASALRAGALVVVFGGAAVVAATRARRAQGRAAVVGRLADGSGGRRPPRRRRWRSWRSAPARLEVELRELDLALDAPTVWRVWRWAPALGGLVGGLLIGAVFGVFIAALVAAAPLVAWVVLRGRAEAAYDTTLAGALDAAARGVRSGGSLPQAIAEAAASVTGRVSADLAHVVTEVERGRPLVDALGAWRVRRSRPSVRLAVGALVLATQTGGPPARVIEDVSGAIRTRQHVAREAQSLAAQARLSALVVGVAPLAFMVITCVTDPRNSHMLFGTPIGLGCMAIGLILDAAGAVWMHRMSATVTE